ncbi:hypothetical protein IFM89_038071 [Coptis chinensis]|uniref:Stress induced protein n=1 Tax=Coptis chinensis TaxID=261450 RepID=A0A835I8G7_9MAGN|nr:hypothetical protein IFM89_038071 [Coptis chinensis]
MERGEEEVLYEETTFDSNGCGCFRFFSFRWKPRSNNDQIGLLHPQQQQQESWVIKSGKKLREISELVAGPKWKNFIRKFSAYRNNKKRTQFQYDPQSYALNFEDSQEEDDFSGRFAAT